MRALHDDEGVVGLVGLIAVVDAVDHFLGMALRGVREVMSGQGCISVERGVVIVDMRSWHTDADAWVMTSRLVTT